MPPSTRPIRLRCFLLSRLTFVMGFALSTLALPAAFAAGAVSEPIRLWPQTAPGDAGLTLPEEKDVSKPGEGLVAGRPLIRLGNVSTPTITVFRPAREKDTGAAVVVCPGGGYTILAMDLEGTEVVEWLNSIGVTGVLLKYRVPARKDRPRWEAPLQDAQRAVSLARHRAAEWGIDPARIGILGFSAGGHLSAAASNQFEKRAYEPVDDADRVSARPDFAVLVYPGYLTTEKDRQQVSPELLVTAKTPPTFLVQTEDDSVPVEGSLFYYLKLKQAKVPAEMHLFAAGGHGYGLRETDQEVTRWPRLVESWMRRQGWLKRR